MNGRRVETPLTEQDVRSLRTSDTVLLNGILYTARDRAHERIRELVKNGERLPFETKGAVLYYAGPAPAPRGKPSGSAGPTTSGRMDPFTETVLQLGVRGLVGKGKRDAHVREMLARYGAVYFGTYGGAGAYLSKRIIRSSLIAFPDLGPEAVYEFEVRDFPAIVINDIYGGDLYESALRNR